MGQRVAMGYEEKDSKRSDPFKLGDDLVDVLRYICHSRPDYFEHPKLNMYGQLEKEEDDEEADLQRSFYHCSM